MTPVHTTRCPPALAATFLVTLAVGLAPIAAREARSEDAWQTEQARVRVVCPLTIGGSFEATTAALSGALALQAPRPPVLSGEIAVDLKTLDTGIGLRNRHMRENYLEVQKDPEFEKAVLTDLKLGDVDPSTFEGKTTFEGVLSLHGVQKPVAGEARIQRRGSKIHVDAEFPLRLADHGIAKPQYLGVGVKPEVQVKVSFVATPRSGAGKEDR